MIFFYSILTGKIKLNMSGSKSPLITKGLISPAKFKLTSLDVNAFNASVKYLELKAILIAGPTTSSVGIIIYWASPTSVLVDEISTE